MAEKTIGTGKQVGYTYKGQIARIDPESGFVSTRENPSAMVVGEGDDQRAVTIKDLTPLYDTWIPAESSNGITQYIQQGVTAGEDGQSKFINDATGQDYSTMPGFGSSWGFINRPGQGFRAERVSQGGLGSFFEAALNPTNIINIGLSAMGGPAAVAAFAAIQGKDPVEIAKSAALSYLGNAVGGEAVKNLTGTVGSTAANVIGNIAKTQVASGGKADPVQALISGGLSAGLPAVLGEIPGFDSMDPKTQAAITRVVSSTLQTGNLSPSQLIDAAIAAGTAEKANSTNVPTESQVNADNQTLIDALAPYEAPAPATSPDVADQLTNAGLVNSDQAEWDVPVDPAELQTALDRLPQEQAEWDVPVAPSDLQAALDGLPQEQAEWDVPVDPADLKTALGDLSSDQAEWDVPVSPSDLKTALDELPQEQAEWDVPVDPDDLNTALTEIASPEPTDTPSPTEKDVLDFIKDHPDATTPATSTTVKPKTTSATKPAATTPKTTTPESTTGTSSAATAAAPTGYMPGVGDVAHIKWDNDLFGVLPWEEQPAPSADNKQRDKDSSEDDVLSALENSQYAIGGHVDDFDVDTLLQILRS